MRCCNKGKRQIAGLSEAGRRRGRAGALERGMKGIIVVMAAFLVLCCGQYKAPFASTTISKNMCGRFGQAYPRMTLKDWYRAAAMPEFDTRYNIAPTTNIVVIRDGKEGRTGSMMRWGLSSPGGSRDRASCRCCITHVPKPFIKRGCSRQVFIGSAALFPCPDFSETPSPESLLANGSTQRLVAQVSTRPKPSSRSTG